LKLLEKEMEIPESKITQFSLDDISLVLLEWVTSAGLERCFKTVQAKYTFLKE
jgi:hypothetical protein